MRIVLGITTYRRLPYLSKLLDSWDTTRNTAIDWMVIVADDGSGKEYIDWIRNRLRHVESHVIVNARRGIHYQVNSILRFASRLDFDFGFKVDDDVVFGKKGWEDAYFQAAQVTGYHHLVHHDPGWQRVKRRKPVSLHESGLLQNCAYWNDLQGAFWTFTKRVIDTVGYVDIERFGLCGFGHRDYTYRCCKAGFNFYDRTHVGYEVYDRIYDAVDSNKYVLLQKDQYRSANDYWGIWNDPESKRIKFSHFCDSRVYVKFFEPSLNIAKASIDPTRAIPLM